MIIIRPEQEKDIPAITEVNNAAFKGQGEAELVEATRASANFVPELSLVAVADDVIGHILFSKIEIETNKGRVPTLGLAPMAVRPDCQSKGIGSALVREGLRMCGGRLHEFLRKISDVTGGLRKRNL